MVVLDYLSWDACEEAFRELSDRGLLKCPVCRETVVFRHGFIRCAHFAHRPNSSCPFSHESMELLEARAALYGLLRNAGIGTVEIEHSLPKSRLPRTVDCWVEAGTSTFAYWIFDRGVKSREMRKTIRSELRSANTHPHFVFHEQLLQRASVEHGGFVLSPTERDFIRRTQFDPEGSESGSLHFIEPKLENLTTLRGLAAQECSGYFKGREIQTFLGGVKVCPATGELFHPWEQPRAVERELFDNTPSPRGVSATDAPPLSPYAHLAPDVRKWREELDKLPRSNKSIPEMIRELHDKGRDLSSISYEEREGICEYCGEKTRDWIVFDGKTGRCKCRKCYPRKQSDDLVKGGRAC
jgi:hypothetical protein